MALIFYPHEDDAQKGTHTDRITVLLEAADEQAIRKTHRRYFADLDELAKMPDSTNK